jgi:hypothetical protein
VLVTWGCNWKKVHFLAIEGLRRASGPLQKAQSSTTVPEDPAALQIFFSSTPEEVVLYKTTWTKWQEGWIFSTSTYENALVKTLSVCWCPSKEGVQQ